MTENRASIIEQRLRESLQTTEKFLSESHQIDTIEQAIKAMSHCLKSGGKILSCGNGGSMCDSLHFSEELTGRFRKDRRPLPALSMDNPGHLTCVANDMGFDQVFSRQVEAFGKEGDVLLAISTSGESQNVVEATRVAKKLSVKTIGLLGKSGGTLKELCDHSIVVSSNVTERIQEIHIKVIHILIEGIERDLFPEHY